MNNLLFYSLNNLNQHRDKPLKELKHHHELFWLCEDIDFLKRVD